MPPMILKGPLLDRACSSGSARNKPRTKFGWDERSRRTTRQPGLRRHPEFGAWLIHADSRCVIVALATVGLVDGKVCFCVGRPVFTS